MLQTGDTFKIKTGTFKGETFTVRSLTPEDSFDVVCTDKHGDTMCFNSAQLETYGYTVLNKAELAKTILMSAHVNSVEASFEYEADGTRYYTAITSRGAEHHKYAVRLWNDADGARFGHCVCSAGSKGQTCRHILKAAELDSEMFNIPMFTDTVVKYRAWKRAA